MWNNMHEYLIAAFTGLSIGFLGSFHCIGMCGPIALALPVHALGKFNSYLSIALYNLGRALTYCALGIFFGMVGSQFRLWGLQQFISIFAGVLILLFILTRFKLTLRLKWVDRMNTSINQTLGQLMQSPRSPLTFGWIGILNGMLPCGLVYVAMAAALASGSTWNGGLLMFAFGFGTMPVMAGLMVFGQRISPTTRRKINRAVPYFVAVMGVLLILRGLNLGIPYVSPRMDAQAEAPMCHPAGE